MKERSMEEKWVWCNQVWAEIVVNMVKAIEEKWKEEGAALARKILYEQGKKIAKEALSILGIKGKEPMDYAQIHYYQDTNLWAIKEEISEGSSGEAIIQAFYCPLQNLLTAEDCKIFKPYVQGMLEVINPSLKFRATKALTKWFSS